QLTAPGLLTEQVKPAQDGQVRRDLHLVVPALKAGGALTLKGVVSTELAFPVKGFAWKDTPGQYAELSLHGRPVLRYMYRALDESSKDARNKSYKVFHHLYDPAGKRFVTNGGHTDPYENEKKLLYPHHRGLMFGFNKVSYDGGKKKADTW